MSKAKLFFMSMIYSLVGFSLIILIIISFNQLTKTPVSTNRIIDKAPLITEKEQNISILIITVKDKTKEAETFTLINLDAEKNKISITSIPETTQATVNIKTDNLKGFYEYGGSKMVAEAVENVFDININRYIRIDLENIISLIDKIGGLETILNRDTNYLDPSTLKFITLPKGRILMDGTMSVNLAIQQLKKQNDLQKYSTITSFLKNIITKTIKTINRENIDKIYTSIINSIDTNISLYDYDYRRLVILNMTENTPEFATVEINGQEKDNNFFPEKQSIEQVKKLFDNNRDLS